ncbi:MAG: hypothetical protein ACREK2_08745 [Gemmatimonadota bacterium]
MRPRVELIYDFDCPNVDEARRELSAALREVGLPARWEETLQGKAGPESEVFGSPTVTVDGRDVAPNSPVPRPVGAASCRIYVDGTGLRGAPSRETIRAALRNAGNGRGGGAGRFGAAGAASTGAGAALVSAAASACCVGPFAAPLIVSVLGAGGAAWAAGLKPYSNWLLGFAAVMLVVGFYVAYRGQRACDAPPRRRDRLVRGVLWVSAALWLVSATVNLVLG